MCDNNNLIFLIVAAVVIFYVFIKPKQELFQITLPEVSRPTHYHTVPQEHFTPQQQMNFVAPASEVPDSLYIGDTLRHFQ